MSSSPQFVVGMIGIGQLGMPVARNLLAAGFDVVGYRPTDRAAFVECGGNALESPAAVGQQADIILLCLPCESAMLEVLEGPVGLLAGLRPGVVVIELGTYAKAFKIAQSLRIQACGAETLEAEVSGSPPLVAQRKASLYLGGTVELIARCQPVLSAITEFHFHIGEYGSAVAMKLIANYLLAIHTLAAAEAMNLGTRAGFDPHMLAAVIGKGAGGSVMFNLRAPMMAARSFTPAPGPFNTLEKYLLMGEQLSRDFDVASPLFSAALPYFNRALASGMGAEDIAAVIKLLEQDSGHSIQEGDAQ